jgi:hypothetical protein
MLRNSLLALVMAVACVCGLPRAEAARWALLIAVDRYQDDFLSRPPLFAEQDVVRLAEALTANGYAHEHVIVMRSEADKPELRPTRAAILQQLHAVAAQQQWTSEDSLLVVFVGAGLCLQGNNYLCPADAKVDDRAGTLLALADFSPALAAMAPAQTCLVVDAGREDMGAAATRLNLFTALRQPAAGADNPPGIAWFASCVAGQRSVVDEQLQHGVFLHYFTEAVSGWADVRVAGNGDGIVSCPEVLAYVSRKTRQRSRTLTGWEQQPWWDGRVAAEMSFTQLSEQRRAELSASASSDSDEPSAAELHAQQAVTEALLALQSGDAATVVSKALEAMDLDPDNRLAHRLAALGYQLQRDYVRALSVLQPIHESLWVRCHGFIPLQMGTKVVRELQPLDVLEISSLRKQPSGSTWAFVSAVHRRGSGDPKERATVRGYVRLTPDANEPGHFYLDKVSAAALVEEFSLRNYQPAGVTNWVWLKDELPPSLRDSVRGILGPGSNIPSIPSIPYIPLLPSPYDGSVRGGMQGKGQ